VVRAAGRFVRCVVRAHERRRVGGGSRRAVGIAAGASDLGTRARIGESSTREQAGAGLGRLNREEYDRLLRLNAEYRARFGFPFLYAVKGSGKAEILAALEARLQSEPDEEFAEALRQVFRIARFRLEEIVR